MRDDRSDACRQDRAQAALTHLRSQAGHDDVHGLLADGASMRENLRLAQEVERRVGHLDVLVNNVGGGASAEWRETPEGLEHGLALNFVGPLALTALAIDSLARFRLPDGRSTVLRCRFFTISYPLPHLTNLTRLRCQMNCSSLPC